MIRGLILGGGGMLGHKAYQAFAGSFPTMVTFRRFDDRLREVDLFAADDVIDGVDAADLTSVDRALDLCQPTVVLNGIGIIKQLPEANDARASIYTNALFPHLLADRCCSRGIRLIHVSTDCVFSGRTGAYTEEDVSDAADLYGKTKYLGEVHYPGTLTVRTSIVGRELFSSLSLVDWFLSQEGERVRGFTKVRYSGLSTIAFARELLRLVTEFPMLEGLYHVASSPISKYDLLCLVRDAYGVSVDIQPFDGVVSDRTMRSDAYRRATGFVAPSWPEMITEMARDATPYERFRRAVSPS